MKTGRVYKIVCSKTDKIYIGSTFQSIKCRFNAHKASYKRYKEKKLGKCAMIYDLFDKYGYEYFSIVLLEKYKVCDRKHLRSKEQLWLRKLKKNCINKQDALALLDITRKYKLKNYHRKNRQEILKQNKIKYEKNKDEINRKRRERRKNDKEYHNKILKQNAESRKRNKEKIRQRKKIKTKCECGCMIVKNNISHHRKTQKHKNLMNRL